MPADFSLLIGLASLLLACGPHAPAAEALSTRGTETAAPGQLVTLFDQHLQLPIRTERVPAGWEVSQQVATDLQTGYYEVFIREVRGPQGECIRDLGPIPYTSLLGKNMTQTVESAIRQGSRGVLDSLRLGQVQPSMLYDSLPGYRAMRPGAGEVQMTGFEIPLQGVQDGKPMQGMAYVLHLPAPQFPETGTLAISLVMSRPARLIHALRTHEGLLRSQQENPEAAARQARIRQQATGRMTSPHEARMQQLQAMHRAQQAMLDQLLTTYGTALPPSD